MHEIKQPRNGLIWVMLSHRPVGILLNIRIGMSQVFKKPLERGRLIRAHFLKKDDFFSLQEQTLKRLDSGGIVDGEVAPTVQDLLDLTKPQTIENARLAAAD